MRCRENLENGAGTVEPEPTQMPTPEKARREPEGKAEASKSIPERRSACAEKLRDLRSDP